MTEVDIVKKFTELEGKVARTEERVNAIEKVQKQIQDLTFSVHDISVSIKSMVSEQQEITKRIDAIEKEPALKWKELTKTIVACLVSAVIAFILAKIGLK